MPKKGTSRKGERRRKTAQPSPPTVQLSPMPVRHSDISKAKEIDEPDTVKLSRENDSIYKTFKRIESKQESLQVSSQETPSELVVSSRRDSNVTDESAWASAEPITKSSRGLWLWLSVVLILLISSVLLVPYLGRSHAQDKPSGYFIDAEAEEMLHDQAIHPLMNDPLTHSKALKLIESLAAAKSLDQVIPLTRSTPTSGKNLQRIWQPLPSPPILQADAIAIDFRNSGNIGYYLIEGHYHDQSPFAFYFVAEQDRLTLDWEASMCVGEVAMRHLSESPPKQPVMVRVIIEPSSYYLPQLPEDIYQSYRLTAPHQTHILWGYVKRDSEVHEKITNEFTQGDAFLESVKSLKMTLQLSPLPDFPGKNRFAITEMLHKDWVIP